MNILVIGDAENLAECEQKFGAGHEYILATDHRDAEKLVSTHQLVFDFIIDEEPYQIEIYNGKNVPVFINSAKISLGELIYPSGVKGTFFGFNGLPTFISAPELETSVLTADDEEKLRAICQELQTGFHVVQDRVGLVTPRIICMIINEAYYTLQEKTATREDIDEAMKLGTNYPFGPFEWCQRLGLKHVYEILEALFDDTKDDRYKICPLLKKEYLSSAV